MDSYQIEIIGIPLGKFQNIGEQLGYIIPVEITKESLLCLPNFPIIPYSKGDGLVKLFLDSNIDSNLDLENSTFPTLLTPLKKIVEPVYDEQRIIGFRLTRQSVPRRSLPYGKKILARD